ncbi:hypothetical protein PIB30_114882, partial [Stylosanthes scabra]|nr:hypothetical protein [Stylosanthes scabra]
MANYKAGKVISKELSPHLQKKLIHDAKYFCGTTLICSKGVLMGLSGDVLQRKTLILSYGIAMVLNMEDISVVIEPQL